MVYYYPPLRLSTLTHLDLTFSADLKNATDDALAPYLTSLPKPYTFRQQHSSTNVRLILGYTAVVIAGVLFYADYKLGWDATKAYTGPACAAYFVLNGLLTYWIWAVEAGTVFVGTREGGQKVRPGHGPLPLRHPHASCSFPSAPSISFHEG